MNTYYGEKKRGGGSTERSMGSKWPMEETNSWIKADDNAMTFET